MGGRGGVIGAYQKMRVDHQDLSKSTMSTDELLLRDFRTYFPRKYNPEEPWALDWSHSDCSTARPVPKDDEGYATAFLTVNFSNDAVQDFRDFFQMAKSNGDLDDHCSLDIDGTTAPRVRLRNANGADIVGRIYGNRTDANVGSYTVLTSYNPASYMMLRKLLVRCRYGYACILDHTETDFQIGDGYWLHTVTGYGDDEKLEAYDRHAELATQFQLKKDDEVVARAHLAYRDCSLDASVGPTLEKIEVRRDQRGENLLPLLWYWVRVFIEENFTLESMNVDAAPGHVMIKATKVSTDVVEVKSCSDITFSDFVYNHLGFSVRRQDRWRENITAALEEETVAYIRLKPLQELVDRKTYQSRLDASKWPSADKKGKRACYHCSRLTQTSQRCSRCKRIYFCGPECQKRSWKRHKLWCGKSRDEFLAVLSERGVAVEQ